MKLSQLVLPCLFALSLFLVNADASIITHSYESDAGLGPGFHFGVQPSDMGTTGVFGDQDPSVHFGVVVDPSLARTGSVAYVTDLGNNGGGAGFGGNFSVSRADAPAGSFGAGSNFQFSVWVAENPNDLVTGQGGNIHYEFYDANGQIVFRTDSFGLQARFATGTDNGDAIPDYNQVSTNYTLGEAIANGRNAHQNSSQGATPVTAATLATIASARAVITGNNGGNTFDGQYLIDDFTFIAAIPEPSTFSMFALLSGGILLRRRVTRTSDSA